MGRHFAIHLRNLCMVEFSCIRMAAASQKVVSCGPVLERSKHLVPHNLERMLGLPHRDVRTLVLGVFVT